MICNLYLFQPFAYNFIHIKVSAELNQAKGKEVLSPQTTEQRTAIEAEIENR